MQTLNSPTLFLENENSQGDAWRHDFHAEYGEPGGCEIPSGMDRTRSWVMSAAPRSENPELPLLPGEVRVPPALAKALDRDPQVRQAFEALPDNLKHWFVLGIDEARSARTRHRRVERVISMLLDGGS